MQNVVYFINVYKLLDQYIILIVYNKDLINGIKDVVCVDKVLMSIILKRIELNGIRF